MNMSASAPLPRKAPVSTVVAKPGIIRSIARIISNAYARNMVRNLMTAAFLAGVGLLIVACEDARYYSYTGSDNTWNAAAKALLEDDNGCKIQQPSEAQIKTAVNLLKIANTVTRGQSPATPGDAPQRWWGIPTGTEILPGNACAVREGSAALASPPQFEVSFSGELQIGKSVELTITGPEGFEFKNADVRPWGECVGIDVGEVSIIGKNVLKTTVEAIRRQATPGTKQLVWTYGENESETSENARIIDVEVVAAQRRRGGGTKTKTVTKTNTPTPEPCPPGTKRVGDGCTKIGEPVNRRCNSGQRLEMTFTYGPGTGCEIGPDGQPRPVKRGN